MQSYVVPELNEGSQIVRLLSGFGSRSVDPKIPHVLFGEKTFSTTRSEATGDVELGQLTPAVFAVDGAKPSTHFFEYLKFDGAPQFDVVAKTKEYLELAPPAQAQHSKAERV